MNLVAFTLMVVSFTDLKAFRRVTQLYTILRHVGYGLHDHLSHIEREVHDVHDHLKPKSDNPSNIDN